ncbi:Uncharacterised protein [Providencia stuartii]|nr:Uncharacterised protein [Providencia stuartii]
MLNITPNFAQERGLAMLRQSWKQNRTFMIYSPTGSGKTGLAAFITNGYIKRNMRVMFLCTLYDSDRTNSRALSAIRDPDGRNRVCMGRSSKL